jgi:Co/Zn/Cd efflux system component
MNKAISLAILAGGIVLIVFGVIAMDSFSSDVSRFFTGSPTDKAVWMLIGGVIATIVGGVGLGLTRGTSSA